MTNRKSISDIPKLLIKEIPPLDGTKQHDPPVTALQNKLVNWFWNRFLTACKVPAVEDTADLVDQDYRFIRKLQDLRAIHELYDPGILREPIQSKISKNGNALVALTDIISTSDRRDCLTSAEHTYEQMKPPVIEPRPAFFLYILAEILENVIPEHRSSAKGCKYRT